MASQDPRLENLDEFDEAEDMPATFCQQMTEQEYEDQTSEMTEKALNELCSYLQGNPEVYYQIIRKKKQEELENAGLFSYLKVKMMSVLHGEQYPACLVSPEQSNQMLNQLRTDMQKAFTYSEESKGRRYSKRIAARSGMATISDKENTPVLSSQQPLRCKRLEPKAGNTATTQGKAKGERVLRSTTKEPKSPLGQSKLRPPLIMAVQPSKTSFDEGATSQVPLSAPTPPPPPPPPPPPLLPIQHRVINKNFQQSQSTDTKRRLSVMEEETNAKRCALVRSPLSSVQRERSSAMRRSVEQSAESKTCRDVDTRYTTPGSSPSSASDNEFVTPETDAPIAKKHKRTLSNPSVGSTGSQCSLSDIHSELMSSNPLTRLRSTQVARSPGGTPLRTLNGPRMPSEPLHKALVTVLRQKFRNVRTPSPSTGGSGISLNSPDPAHSKNVSLNTTFSP